MKSIPSKLFLLGALTFISLPSSSFAHRKIPQPPPPPPVIIRADLNVHNDDLPDLAEVQGKLVFISHRGKSALGVMVKIPAVAPSLGIIDDASAEDAQIHLEILRDNAVIGDCSLELKGERRMFRHRDREHRKLLLFVKDHGRPDIKGSCGGSVPAIQEGDVFNIFAIIGENRVDFLSNSEDEDEPPFIPPPR